MKKTFQFTVLCATVLTGFLSCQKNDSMDIYDPTLFCITALEDGMEVSMELDSKDLPHTEHSLAYSLDGLRWNEFRIGETTVRVQNAQDVVYLKATKPSNGFATLIDSETANSHTLKITKKHAVSGNILSLLNEKTDKAKMDKLAFLRLFSSDVELMDASGLILPSTGLSDRCFCAMFWGCSGLIKGPELPAVQLETGCYMGMFGCCSKLQTAPELPATSLATGCYYDMFVSCNALQVTPELPADNLADLCYSEMFWGCYGLTKTNGLPATKLATQCYASMFEYCTGLVEAPALPAAVLESGCYAYMFSECRSLTKAPELAAPQLAEGCYCYMFNGCTLLDSVTCLATDLSAPSCLDGWLTDVAESGTLTAATGIDWTGNIPDGWNVRHQE